MLDQIKTRMGWRSPQPVDHSQTLDSAISTNGRPRTWLAIVLLMILGPLPLSQAIAAPSVTITADPATIEEGGDGEFIIEVTDNAYPCFAFDNPVVNVSVSLSGSATVGVDYQTPSLQGNIVSVPIVCTGGEFPLGSGTARIAVISSPDNLIESDETIVLESLSCQIPPGDDFRGSNTPCAASDTMAIVDTTRIARIEASDPSASRETLDPGAFLVSLNAPAFEGGLTVAYSTSGTASAGSDYAALPGSVQIPAGQTSAIITVTPLAGDPGDPETSLVVTLQPNTGYAVGTPASATVTIAGRALPVASIIASDPNASRETLDPGAFLINLDIPAPSGGLTVAYGTAGSAVAGTDYEPLPGSLLIPGGQTSAAITVTPRPGEADGRSADLIATILPGTGYDVGTPASATVSLGGRTRASLSVVSGNDQLATVRQPLEPFVVRVQNTTGAVAGAAVIWELIQGDGNLSTTRSTTNPSGETSTTLTPGNETQYRVRATLEATGDWVEITAIASAPLADLPGLTPGQRSVAGALDSLCPKLNALGQRRALTAGEQDLLTQCKALIGAAGSNPGAVTQGIVALTPEQASAPRKLITQISSIQVTNLTQRLNELRHGARGISLGGLQIGAGGQTISGSLLEKAIKEGLEAGGGASADEDWPFERLGIFITGNVQWGAKDRSTNEDGFDYDMLGLTAGADYRFSNGLIMGTALGYTSTGVDIDADGGTLDDESWSLSLYATYYPTEHFYLEGSATYGWDSYDQDRNIGYSLLDAKRTANARFDGDQYTLLLGAGYDLIRGGTILDMYGRLQYTSASIDDYREQGASGLDLVIQGQDAVSFKTILGTQVSRSISTQRAVLNLQGWIQWEHEFEKGDDQVKGYFANDPNRFGFALPTDALETDLVRLGVGLGAQFGQGRTAFISYQAALGMQDYTENTITAGVSLAF